MAISAAEYLALLQQLLPPGAALTREPSANVTKLLSAFAEELARIDARVDVLLDETHPDSLNELLPDWERSLGLPDNCVLAELTVADRRASVKGRLTNTGGASPQYFIDLAESLGFTITIQQPTLHNWEVHAPTEELQAFRAGVNAAGDPLRVFGAEQTLECVFLRLKPAHTALTFIYS